MYKCTVKTYNLLNSIRQTHATVDLCVSVFSTDMHSSSLGAGPIGFLCRHKVNNLSSQCALHKHHKLNNLGIRQEISQFGKINFVFKTIFGKIDFQIHKNLKNRLVFQKYSEKSIFIMQGRLHTPTRSECEDLGRGDDPRHRRRQRGWQTTICGLTSRRN